MGETGRLRRRRHSSRESEESSTTRPNSRKSSLTDAKKRIEVLGPCERVIHQPQDSLFSLSSGWTNYRGFFNLSMLLLVISNGRVGLENIIKYGILINPLQWLQMLIEDLSVRDWPNLTIILGSNVSILMVFVMEKILEKEWIGNRTAAVFYVILFPAHLAIPAIVTLMSTSTNPIFSMIAMGGMVIEVLKLISYVHVNYWARCSRLHLRPLKEKLHETAHATKDTKRKYSIPDLKDELTEYEMASLYPASLSLKNLYYFMLAPTLCYEFKFPRTKRIRKHFLIKRLVEFIFLTFLIAALVQQWIVPLVQNSIAPLSEMALSRCLERLLKLAIPNHMIWLIFFYTFFHSGLNLTAELLKFADREFYRDFWNAETIAYFWKSWNIPVHRFALRHIYLPMIRHNFRKNTAVITVFLVSAFFHEYLVSVPLQMFRLWACYGMLAQVPLSYVTDKVIKGGRTGNIIMWLSLIVGQPLAILMYMHDWYVIHDPSSQYNTAKAAP